MAEEADLLGLNDPIDDDEWAQFATARASNREDAPILPDELLSPAEQRGRQLLSSWEREQRASSRSPSHGPRSSAGAPQPPPAPLIDVPMSPVAVREPAADPPAAAGAGASSTFRSEGRSTRADGRRPYRDADYDRDEDRERDRERARRAFEDDEREFNEAQAQAQASFFDRLGFGRRARPLSYAVTFEHGPIGLELETDWYGRQAVVKGFKKGLRGEDMPAKACGQIHVGDVLTSINGESVLDLSFQDTLTRLRELSNSRHTLVFKDLAAAGDLSIYSGDQDIREARMFIHEHKMRFYEPPPESDEMVYAYVERHRGEHVTAFNLHREDTGEFLLAASCDSEMSGPFVYHTLQDSYMRTMSDIPRSEDSAVYLGCSDGNFLGTEFTVHDHRVSLTEAERPMHELAFITYETNILGRVPNFLKCVVPRVAAEGTEQAMQTRSISERFQTLRSTRRRESLMESIRNGLGVLERSGSGSDVLGPPGADVPAAAPPSPSATGGNAYRAVETVDGADLMIFQTKKPSWNEELCAWTLNFNGRVKQASKKNFLLISERGNDAMEDEFGPKVLLRFGKVAKTKFTCDFRYPLSPLVALAVASTAFARKLAVT